jgi:RND family efflux transporter MFP subunit
MTRSTAADARRMRTTAFGLVTGLTVAASAACDRGVAAMSDTDEPLSVRAFVVLEEAITRPIFATGMVSAKDEVPLSFKIGGVVARVDAAAGARVRAGRTLAALDLREIDAAVMRARSAAEKAERDLERARRLYDDSVFTLAHLQDTETAAQVARADLDAALVNHAFAVIAAPADGVILRRHAEPGEMVGPGSPILVFASDTRGRVLRVGLADRDLVRVRRGDTATVRFPALPGVEFTGRVADISAAAEPGTGTYAVEIAIAGGIELASGLIGTAQIIPSDRTTMTMVPIEAVIEADGSRAVVFTLSADGTHAERREITLAFIDGARVAVSHGLEAGVTIVTDGAPYLDHGTRVRVVP